AAQTMTAILERAPAPLSGAGLQVPPDLDRAIMRCLEKDPAARTQSARDLSVVLRDIARGSSAPDFAPARARAGRTALAALALVVLVAALAAAYYYRGHAGQTNSIAILPFVNASGNPDMDYLGDGITESLINSLAQAPNLTVMSRTAVFRYK